MSDPKLTYQRAGVDPAKAAQILSAFSRHQESRPKDPRLLSGIGPFASCYSLKGLLAEYHDPLLVTSCDGVGTKARLAIDWGHIEGLGQDLVAMNVNDILCVGARPVLFLDYYACGVLREEQLLPLLKSIQSACEQTGCSLAGGETAEMPGIYQGLDFDLAGFAVGIVDKAQVLGPDKVRPGDRLIALASSGPHSNGFSLLRKLVEREGLRPDGISPFGPRWKDCLLAPTTLYVKPVLEVASRLHAAAHLTGGGLFENLPRVLPENTDAVVSASSWKFPPLFSWVQEKAGLSTEELLSTFNAGVGMILVAPATEVAATVSALKKQGVDAWDVGSVEPSQGLPRVLWQSA